MVQKTFILVAIERLKSLPWHQLFYMFYIEPIVFTLIFSHLLSDFQAIETEIQSYVADMFLTRTLMESIVPAICGLFSGSWSDHYGRKPLLIVSMIGFAGSAVITTIICALSRSYEVNPWWYTLAAVPHSLLGGMCVFSVAAYCFLSDITDIKTRPYRMIFMEMLIFVALSSGSLLSSFVYAATNAAVTQGISASLITIVTVYIVCYLPESLHIRLALDADEAEVKADKNVPITSCDPQFKCISIDCSNKLSNVEKVEKATTDLDIEESKENAEKPEQPLNETDSKTASLFSLTHLKDMLVTCCKPRKHHARGIIWLVTLTMFMTMFVVDGVMTVMYLFVRQKFHWSVREFTFFETVNQLVPMLGALVGFLILRKIFGVSVVVLALLSLSSEILSNLVKGFAELTWHMYLSIAFAAFRSIGGPMCRTIVSNIVPASDLGKIFSIKNVLQSIAPFVAAPLYTFIYQRSLSFSPGLFNFLSAALFFVAFVAIGCVLRIKIMHKQHYAVLLK